jgi:hypothetical protein
MKQIALLALVTALGGCPATTTSGSAVVTTGPGPTRPMPDRSAPRWDSTGWTLLGTQTVDGRTDRDIINVAKRARWDKLTLVVEDSDLELLDLDVEFANGERWSPKLAHTFREGQRSRAIDLPGDDRQIAKITLLYRNTPGGGRARVEVYAKDVRTAGYTPQPSQPGYNPQPTQPGYNPQPTKPPTGYTPTPSQPPPPSWDATGWTLLGSQSVEGKKDKDTYAVGRKVGKLDKLTVVVKDSDLEMLDFVVVFENGQKFEPKIKHTFKEGERTRAIDLPGNDRWIKQINVRYANLPGGGKARVEIYGRDTRNAPTGGPAPMPPQPAEDWKGKGFTLIGSQSVDGKKDRDIYNVGRKVGRMDVLVVVVKGSDLEMQDFVVNFDNGDKWEPKIRHTFKEGTASRQIDLPGSDRYIKNIEVRYGNLPGGGKAVVELYGRDTKQGANPKQPKK